MYNYRVCHDWTSNAACWSYHDLIFNYRVPLALGMRPVDFSGFKVQLRRPALTGNAACWIYQDLRYNLSVNLGLEMRPVVVIVNLQIHLRARQPVLNVMSSCCLFTATAYGMDIAKRSIDAFMFLYVQPLCTTQPTCAAQEMVYCWLFCYLVLVTVQGSC